MQIDAGVDCTRSKNTPRVSGSESVDGTQLKFKYAVVSGHDVYPRAFQTEI